MAKIIENSFTSYEITPSEDLAASSLTHLQRCMLQNAAVIIAEELMLLLPDTVNYSEYLQKQAYLRGKYDAIKSIIETSDLIQVTQAQNNQSQGE